MKILTAGNSEMPVATIVILIKNYSVNNFLKQEAVDKIYHYQIQVVQANCVRPPQNIHGLFDLLQAFVRPLSLL